MPEQIAYWRFRATHYKNTAIALNQELQALKQNAAERHYYNPLTYRDRTGTEAVENITRNTRKKD